MRLLHEIVTPVGEVEAGEDRGEDDPGQDVDLLGSRRELVQPEAEVKSGLNELKRSGFCGLRVF